MRRSVLDQAPGRVPSKDIGVARVLVLSSFGAPVTCTVLLIVLSELCVHVSRIGVDGMLPSACPHTRRWRRRVGSRRTAAYTRNIPTGTYIRHVSPRPCLRADFNLPPQHAARDVAPDHTPKHTQPQTPSQRTTQHTPMRGEARAFFVRDNAHVVVSLCSSNAIRTRRASALVFGVSSQVWGMLVHASCSSRACVSMV